MGRGEAAVAKGETALAQVAGRLGKYDYKQRAVIEGRLQAALRKAYAQPYLRSTLAGREGSRDGGLRWERDAAALARASDPERPGVAAGAQPWRTLAGADGPDQRLRGAPAGRERAGGLRLWVFGSTNVQRTTAGIVLDSFLEKDAARPGG